MEIDPKQPKPLHYALIMDERRNTILSAMFEAGRHTEAGSAVFDAVCNQEGIDRQEVAEFIRDWSDKEHELDWCKSFDCKYPKKEII